MTDGVEYWRGLAHPFRRWDRCHRLVLNMLGYAIVGGIMVLAGIFLLVSVRRSLQKVISSLKK